ncbi:hypothetical protein [Alicyclobacillus vulcanalis]|uniref:Uncharacterized protein n=1 Tax=Alicyclobacillus vulcanalis TaxID=252246 RepID=A0A1N7JMA1_9BACL|nr:hypothetical protein [Alicyclobacillus vulcanalis]SIS50492.1 hypothetical protein SAMN05421799_10171 [Alicyclobacillus vulcanalis]
MQQGMEGSEAWTRCLAAVREAADIAATFDGRLSHEPIDQGVRLAFAHPGRPARHVRITLWQRDGGIRIVLQAETDASTEDAVYDGPASPTSAMQATLAAIGRWYGDEVRRLAAP